MMFAVVQVSSHAAAALLMRLLGARPAAARTEDAEAGGDFTQCADAVIRRMRIRRRSAIVACVFPRAVVSNSPLHRLFPCPSHHVQCKLASVQRLTIAMV